HRVRVAESVVALRDADLAEVIARGAVGAHVVRGEEGEARVRPARAVREHGVAREYAEAAEALAKRIHVIRIRADARDDLGVAGLHRSKRASQRHDAAGAAER